MKGFAVTNFEDVSVLEVKEIISEKAAKEKNAVIFEATPKKLCDLCYHGRSFSRVCELICSFEFKNLDDIDKKIKIKGFSAKTFAVKCLRQGNHEFSSADVEKIAGSKINSKVDLKNPQKTILAYVCGNKFYLGIDYSGFDLGKRDYKIFSHPASIRGDIAYSLLRLAGFQKKNILLDPFCGSGTIPIEASLFCSGKSVNFSRKDEFAFLKFMKYKFIDEKAKKCSVFASDISKNSAINAQKNAKIAGAEVNFSVLDAEWLDTKFEENYFDKIITNLPHISSWKNPEKAKKAIEEMFHNAKYLLKAKGTVAVLTKNCDEVKKIAQKNGFSAKKEHGIQDFLFLVF